MEGLRLALVGGAVRDLMLHCRLLLLHGHSLLDDPTHLVHGARYASSPCPDPAAALGIGPYSRIMIVNPPTLQQELSV